MLLVDGLDEDQGVTGQPDAHSIAALLPAVPPENTRVIVAGRPDPPVPADVPPRHPLRDVNIVRPLDASPQARIIRDDAQRELGHLLEGGGLARQLLGLVTAAGGGLSCDDLAYLAESPRADVLRQIRGFSARSLQARVTATGERVYLLAHETLQATAEDLFGRDILPYRDRIHAWAERYKAAGWPEDTPGYLLVGYSKLLTGLRDRVRLVRLASDSRRHQQMARYTRSDFAALAEISAVQGLMAAGQDLTALTLVAIERERITSQNAAIPAQLMRVWVRLGQTEHALELVQSIPASYGRILGQVEFAAALAESDPDSAVRFAEQAEGVAFSLGSPEYQASALSQIAVAYARAGRWDRAQKTADALGDLGDRAAALAAVADAAAERDPARAARFAEQAEKLARLIPDYVSRASALAKVAVAFARAGQPDRVGATARSRGGGRLYAWEMADLAAMLASYNPDRAIHLADKAQGLLGSTPDPAAVMCEIGVALARAGRLDRAEGIARSLRNPKKRARVAAELAVAAARSRQWDRAKQMAGTLSDPEHQARVQAAIAMALMEAGQWSRAENVARTITDPFERAQALIRVAEKMATSAARGGAGEVPHRTRGFRARIA